jgi:hypothetical protein
MACFGGSSGPAADAPNHPVSHATLLELIRLHGSQIMSYSKLQPGLEHFYVPELGCISFCIMQVGPPFLFKNRPAILGDPLCAPENRERLTRLFLEKHPRSFFVQVSRDYALLLQRCFNLRATCMGGETELDVSGGYNLSGVAKHPLRNAASAAQREGCYVRELRRREEGGGGASTANSDGGDYEDAPEVEEGLRRVDAAWAATKGAHHAARIWFINRAPVFLPEPGVRKFVAWQQKRKGGGEGAADATTNNNHREMVAYIFFDPVYENGRMCGAYANVTRISPDAPHGCLNLIMREALAQFRRELELEREAEAAKRGDDADADDDVAAAARDQDDTNQPAKLSRKQRLALKQAALMARTQSTEELRAARAAKKAAAAAGGSGAARAASAPPPSSSSVSAPRIPSCRSLASTKSGRLTNTTNLPPFFVSLGMAPFFALGGGSDDPVDPDIPGERSATRVMEWVYEHGQTFYPYKAIAFSKTRYGGGLDERTRTFPRDPAARWRPVYAASSLDAPTFVALFDLGALVGFWKGPFNAIATFVRYEFAGLKRKIEARVGKGGKGGKGGGGDEAALFGAVGLGQQQQQQQLEQQPSLASASTTAAAAPAAQQVKPPALVSPPSPSFASAASDVDRDVAAVGADLGSPSSGGEADVVASVEDGDALPRKGGHPAAAPAAAVTVN